MSDWGGAEGIRTPDPLHAMEVRYQLRYSPVPYGVAVTRCPGGSASLHNPASRRSHQYSAARRRTVRPEP